MQQQAKAGRSSVRERDLWDRIVNNQFGDAQPILSEQESIAAAKRLWRMAMGKPFPGEIKITSGNRYTWTRSRVLYVNPDRREPHCRGLRALIHDLSHLCHRRLYPNDGGHSSRQAYLERDMTAYAIKHGFHEGRLKSKAEPKGKPDRVSQRYRQMISRRDKWAKEIERATRLHAKAVREVKQYESRHRDRLSA